MLLLLLDDKRQGLVIRIANHLTVLTLIYITHTSGALIGYAAGMLYRFVYAEGNHSRWMRWAMMIAIVLTIAAVFALIPANTFRAADLIVDKVKVAGENADRVLSGKQIEYYEIIQKKGADVTSGAWRLFHWHQLWGKYWESGLDKILFGFGVGTTTSLFHMKPHNDYLRLLLETGIAGLSLFLFVWVSMYRQMDVKYRWAVVMVAVYSVTENNYDHFLSMSLLVLYMLGAKKTREHRVDLPAQRDCEALSPLTEMQMT
jgi:O-antigen ligase